MPCIRCNQRVKFRDLLGTARDLGANALGDRALCAPRRRAATGRNCTAPATRARDQSYFLFATTRDRARFPALSAGRSRQGRDAGVGAALRPRRSPTSRTARTSALCRRAPMPALVERLRARGRRCPATSSISDGDVLGRHRGIAHFTVGQRKGLGLAGGEPLYVLRIEPEHQPDRRRTAHRIGADATGARRIQLADPSRRADGGHGEAALDADPRRRRLLLRGDGDGEMRLELAAPAGAVAPGQAAVLYDGERVVGGGWIRAERGGGLTLPAASPISGPRAAG